MAQELIADDGVHQKDQQRVFAQLLQEGYISQVRADEGVHPEGNEQGGEIGKHPQIPIFASEPEYDAAKQPKGRRYAQFIAGCDDAEAKFRHVTDGGQEQVQFPPGKNRESGKGDDMAQDGENQQALPAEPGCDFPQERPDGVELDDKRNKPPRADGRERESQKWWRGRAP